MNREHKICAYCRSFSTKDHPQEASQGMGACTGYETPVTVFVPWDGKFCVLFGRADVLAPRERFVREQMDKRQGEVA